MHNCVCCPLEGLDFKRALMGLSNADMNKPYNKSFYKDCYPEILNQFFDYADNYKELTLFHVLFKKFV